MLYTIWHNQANLCLSVEILCSSRHHRVSVGGPGSRGLPGHAAHAVWHHDSGSSPLPEEVPAGKVCFPGGAGVRHTLLDVLHPPWGHREVINWIYYSETNPNLQHRSHKTCSASSSSPCLFLYNLNFWIKNHREKIERNERHTQKRQKLIWS